eukprot:gene15878-biopygen3718
MGGIPVGFRYVQRRAGPCPARHGRRLASDGSAVPTTGLKSPAPPRRARPPRPAPRRRGRCAGRGRAPEPLRPGTPWTSRHPAQREDPCSIGPRTTPGSDIRKSGCATPPWWCSFLGVNYHSSDTNLAPGSGGAVPR